MLINAFNSVHYIPVSVAPPHNEITGLASSKRLERDIDKTEE